MKEKQGWKYSYQGKGLSHKEMQCPSMNIGVLSSFGVPLVMTVIPQVVEINMAVALAVPLVGLAEALESGVACALSR